jgi:putative FmdB family regulatory protein
MPIYEYHCNNCGKFEELVAMDERFKVTCPDCGGKPQLMISKTYSKMANLFTKDGEGFTSVTYSNEEAKFRARNNMHKEDRV